VNSGFKGGLTREILFSRIHDAILHQWECGEISEAEMERRMDRIEGKTQSQLSSIASRMKLSPQKSRAGK
jgi:hypothetical protein